MKNIFIKTLSAIFICSVTTLMVSADPISNLFPDKYNALTSYYQIENNYADNSKAKIFDILQKNNALTQKDAIKIFNNADRYPASFFKAVEENIIPQEFPLNYKICKNKVIMDSMMETYELMKENKFSEKEIKNTIFVYSNYLFDDEETVPQSEIKSIVYDNSIPQNEKFYYIYAKLKSKHYNNPKVENDILNSYKLLKKNPSIVEKGFDRTILNDEILRIINFHPSPCITEETIKYVLAMPNVSNQMRFYKILSILQKTAQLKENEKHSDTLTKIAEVGVLASGFREYKEVSPYYNDEAVLKDVLSAGEILMENRYLEDWPEIDFDIFTIAPDLKILSKTVQKIVDDKKIPTDKKELYICAEMYKAKNEKEQIFNNMDLVYEGIVKSYYPNYRAIDFLENLSSEDLSMLNDSIGFMTKSGFNKEDIKTFVDFTYTYWNDIDIEHLYITTSLASRDNTIPVKEKPKKVLKEMLMMQKDNPYVQYVRSKDYSDEELEMFISAIETMEKYDFSDNDIRVLKYLVEDFRNVIEVKDIYDAVETVTQKPNLSKKDMPNEVFKLVISAQNNNPKNQRLSQNLDKLINASIITTKTINDNESVNVRALRTIDDTNLNALISLKTTEGFKDRDIAEFTTEKALKYLPHLSEALNNVLSDKSIPTRYRPVFVYAYAEKLSKNPNKKTK